MSHPKKRFGTLRLPLRKLPSDLDAKFDSRTFDRCISDCPDGHMGEQVARKSAVGITDRVPDRDDSCRQQRVGHLCFNTRIHGLCSGEHILTDVRIDRRFYWIPARTAACSADLARSRRCGQGDWKVAQSGVHAMVVPRFQGREAGDEPKLKGLTAAFRLYPGLIQLASRARLLNVRRDERDVCSRLGERCASTSNRNFDRAAGQRECDAFAEVRAMCRGSGRDWRSCADVREGS